MDSLLNPFTIGLVAIVAAIFAGIYVWEQNKTKEILASTPDSVKRDLMDLESASVAGNPNAWTQKGYVSEVKDKGSKVVLRVLVCDALMPNVQAGAEKLIFTDIKAAKADIESRGIKAGSFVRVMLDPTADDPATLSA